MGYVIGVSGKIGSGKGTAAQYMIDSMPEHHFVEKFFAYNVKAIAAIISGYGMDVQLSQDGKNVELPMYGKEWTVGKLQQFIGTDLFRQHFDDQVWIKSLFAPFGYKDNWIVSDVRFKNEAEYIRKRGGVLVRLDGDPGGVRARSTRDLNHPSETDLDDYPYFDIVHHTYPGTEHFVGMVDRIRDLITLKSIV